MFKFGDQVIVKRSSGKWETNWFVTDVRGSYIEVASPFENLTITKVVPAEMLSEWQHEAAQAVFTGDQGTTELPFRMQDEIERFIDEATR